MWVFDGEEWRQDGEEEATTVRSGSTAPFRVEDLYAELQLQVVEIAQTPRKSDVPPFPI